MIFVPYLPVHLFGLYLQDAQKEEQILLTPEYAETLFIAGPAWTGLENGLVIGCAGVWDQGHKGMLWALLSENCKGSMMIQITKKVLRELVLMKNRRLEFHVRDLPEQHRWARMLGFNLETPEGMEKACHDGAKAFLYSRVK